MRRLRELLERGWSRPAPTPGERRTDVVVGLVGAVVCVASVELYRSANGALGDSSVTGAYALFALAGLLLVLRRVLPLTSLVAQSALFIVIGVVYDQLAVTFTVQMILFAVLYSAWAWSRRPRSLYVVTALVLLAMFGWLGYQLVTVEVAALPVPGLVSARTATVVYSLAINVVYFLGAIAWGQSAWRSTRRRAALAEQHERERAAEGQRRRRVVQDERVRIARDLHDVVAHHISGIGLQAAGAGRVMAHDPQAAEDALATIESSSRQAVAGMHQLVGLLRDAEDDPSGDRSPQPGVADIAALVDGGCGTERPVIAHRVVGEPFPVPGTTSHSLYRIAQEAVTNTRRHSGARTATLFVRYLTPEYGRQVELELIDDGRVSPARPDGSADGAAAGYGLTGIRERAAMHGGATDIGPRPQGGFRVRVRVPVDGGAR